MDEWIGLILGGLTLLTPIVFILTKHQQKMAMILHQQSVSQPAANTAELADLRQLMHQQAIMIDNLAKSQAALSAQISAQTEVATRLQSTNY